MSTINNVSNPSIWNVQSNNQVSNKQEQTKVHHHHHHPKTDSQDSVQISNEGKTESDNSAKNPLSSLVTNGTISQEQENSIKSAFLSARQASMNGTYGNKPTSPLNSLVTNGTITQAQADSITSAFKSRAQSNENNNQINGTQSAHHHHHHHNKVQDSSENNASTVQPSQSNNLILNTVTENPVTQDAPTANKESTS